jgi:hypothetical protein
MPNIVKLLQARAVVAGQILGSAILLAAAFGALEASAAPILASATRTAGFLSASTVFIPVPLRDNGATSLPFATPVVNQKVVILYNAECAVAAARGTRLSIRILVDGIDAAPVSGADFSLCSAVDANGATWASVLRQSVMTVPASGNHTLKILARLVGASGTWRLDDSSLVVQPALAFASRTDALQSTTAAPVQLPLTENGAKLLSFATTAANERLKITYNAECVVAASLPGERMTTSISVAGVGNSDHDNLCNSVDITGQTWAGTARQFVLTVPAAGTHTAAVYGQLDSGPATWQIDDSSLAITRSVLASAVNTQIISTSTTAEVPVPIMTGGATALPFTTTKNNQVVKLSYNALCAILGQRGRWLGIRLEVDGVEAAPASGYDFALCSAVEPLKYYYTTAFRQSVITVPNAGAHNVRLYARISDFANWYLGQQSLTVE